MLSRIQIDTDQSNNPVIVVDYKDSPDLRDKFVKKFSEHLGGDSFTISATFEDGDHLQFGNRNKLVLRPLSPKEVIEHCVEQLAISVSQHPAHIDINKMIEDKQQEWAKEHIQQKA